MDVYGYKCTGKSAPWQVRTTITKTLLDCFTKFKSVNNHTKVNNNI